MSIIDKMSVDNVRYLARILFAFPGLRTLLTRISDFYDALERNKIREVERHASR